MSDPVAEAARTIRGARAAAALVQGALESDQAAMARAAAAMGDAASLVTVVLELATVCAGLMRTLADPAVLVVPRADVQAVARALDGGAAVPQAVCERIRAAAQLTAPSLADVVEATLRTSEDLALDALSAAVKAGA